MRENAGQKNPYSSIFYAVWVKGVFWIYSEIKSVVTSSYYFKLRRFLYRFPAMLQKIFAKKLVNTSKSDHLRYRPVLMFLNSVSSPNIFQDEITLKKYIKKIKSKRDSQTTLVFNISKAYWKKDIKSTTIFCLTK